NAESPVNGGRRKPFGVSGAGMDVGAVHYPSRSRRPLDQRVPGAHRPPGKGDLVSVLDRAALEDSPLADLHALASELGIDGFRRLRKAQLVDAILARQGGEDGVAVEAEAEAEAEAGAE